MKITWKKEQLQSEKWFINVKVNFHTRNKKKWEEFQSANEPSKCDMCKMWKMNYYIAWSGRHWSTVFQPHNYTEYSIEYQKKTHFFSYKKKNNNRKAITKSTFRSVVKIDNWTILFYLIINIIFWFFFSKLKIVKKRREKSSRVDEASDYKAERVEIETIEIKEGGAHQTKRKSTRKNIKFTTTADKSNFKPCINQMILSILR